MFKELKYINRNMEGSEDPIIDEKGELVKGLLDRCETTNLPTVYKKIISKSQGIASLEKLLSINSYFTIENITNDLKKIDDIILLGIFPFVLQNKAEKKAIYNYSKENYHKKNPFEPSYYILDKIGLRNLIRAYWRENIIPKKVSLNKLEKKLRIQSKISDKFRNMLKNIIKDIEIYAVLEKDQNSNEIILRYTGKLLHPSNRRLLYELILAIISGIILIIIMFCIVSPIWNQF
ncbi:MAG: hypothetical protein GF364_14850 [Candidatus Lokiarchaeota archaeon]|nr:hypothetical protein [Candidatus Lokiarchaeota archaeon]